MSTRCQVLIKDDYGESVLFYRHSDGYPEGAMPTLQKYMGWVRRGIIRNNAEQSSGWLILIGAKEYDNKYVTGKGWVEKENLFEPATEDDCCGWKCGAYEPATSRHGDIEYLYILNLSDKSITCYKTSFDGKDLPDSKDSLLFTDTEKNPWTHIKSD